MRTTFPGGRTIAQSGTKSNNKRISTEMVLLAQAREGAAYGRDEALWSSSHDLHNIQNAAHVGVVEALPRADPVRHDAVGVFQITLVVVDEQAVSS